jgi:hypothetical protein
MDWRRGVVLGQLVAFLKAAEVVTKTAHSIVHGPPTALALLRAGFHLTAERYSPDRGGGRG